jgi:hypothetical protein
MEPSRNGALLALVVAACLLAPGASAQEPQELNFNVGPGASVLIVNMYGPVVVRPAAGRQVLVTATARAASARAEGTQSGNRVEVRTRMEGQLSPQDALVEYEVLVPLDAAVTVRAGSGPVLVEKLRGDLTLQGESAAIEARDITRAHLQIGTIDGAITVHNVSGHVEVTSVGGDVHLRNVNGPKVTVKTTRGSIHYAGSFGEGGQYSLTNHTGNIEIELAPNTSADVSAHSATGSVENTFPFKPRQAAESAAARNRFSGISQAGSSSVNLSSLSGRIRIKAQ